MHLSKAASLFCLLVLVPGASAQVLQVEPQVRTKSQIEGKVTVLEVAAHFVTTIRMPETVNSVVVGDPVLFQVEHSDREPELVFVKALTTRPAETNLLISTTRGHEASLLLISRGEQNSQSQAKVDFLRSEEHTSELQSPDHLVCRLLLEKKKKKNKSNRTC